MPDENMSVEVPPLPKDDGSVLAGCGIGCGVQVLFILIFLLISTLTHPLSNKASGTAVIVFGFSQWLLLGPLIWKLRGKRQTVVGMVLTGVIGVLLSSACGATLMNFHL